MCAAFEAVDRLVEVHVISGSVTIITLTLEGLHIYLKTVHDWMLQTLQRLVGRVPMKYGVLLVAFRHNHFNLVIGFLFI